MTAAELIHALSKMPPDRPVTFGCPDGDCVEVIDIALSDADEGEVVYIEVM